MLIPLLFGSDSLTIALPNPLTYISIQFATVNSLFNIKIKLYYKKYIIVGILVVKNQYLSFPAMISLCADNPR